MSSDSAFVLFVPYAPPQSQWVVRRARTIVERHTTRREAVAGARHMAAEMVSHLGTQNVRIEVQDADGGWRVVPLFEETRPA